MSVWLHELDLLRASLSMERAAEFDAQVRNLIADFTPIDPRLIQRITIVAVGTSEEAEG